MVRSKVDPNRSHGTTIHSAGIRPNSRSHEGSNSKRTPERCLTARSAVQRPPPGPAWRYEGPPRHPMTPGSGEAGNMTGLQETAKHRPRCYTPQQRDLSSSLPRATLDLQLIHTAPRLTLGPLSMISVMTMSRYFCSSRPTLPPPLAAVPPPPAGRSAAAAAAGTAALVVAALLPALRPKEEGAPLAAAAAVPPSL